MREWVKDRLTYYRDATHLKSIMTRGGLGNQVIFVRAARVCMSCHTPVSFEMREHLYNLPLPSLSHTLTTFLTCLSVSKYLQHVPHRQFLSGLFFLIMTGRYYIFFMISHFLFPENVLSWIIKEDKKQVARNNVQKQLVNKKLIILEEYIELTRDFTLKQFFFCFCLLFKSFF